MTVGHHAAHVNVGLPGTGVSYRMKIAKGEGAHQLKKTSSYKAKHSKVSPVLIRLCTPRADGKSNPKLLYWRTRMRFAALTSVRSRTLDRRAPRPTFQPTWQRRRPIPEIS